MNNPAEEDSNKCCFCIKLKCGIILIGIWFIIESLIGSFYVTTEELLESTLYGITTLSSIILAGHFIATMVKKDSLKVRDSWITFMLIDMALNLLLAALRLFMVIKTDFVKEECEVYYGYEIVEGEDADGTACMEEMKKMLMGRIIGVFLIYLLVRLWFLSNIMDWRNKLGKKQEKLKKEAISRAIHDS